MAEMELNQLTLIEALRRQRNEAMDLAAAWQAKAMELAAMVEQQANKGDSISPE